jgi:C4-type Zn-finger protein
VTDRERAMNETKECPLCGELMHRVPRTITDRVPGHSQTLTKVVREWTCKECDYFEEEEFEDWERPASR